MCFGSNFALLGMLALISMLLTLIHHYVLIGMSEMKILVAAIWSRFQSKLTNTDDKEDATGLEQEDGYTVGPVKGKLDVCFIML